MNILLLSNSAPNYHHFFKALVRLLAGDGANVAVAVDSTFSRKENRLDDLEFASVRRNVILGNKNSYLPAPKTPPLLPHLITHF